MKRLGAVILAAGLVAAACSGAAETTDGDGSTTTLPTTTTTTMAPTTTAAPTTTTTTVPTTTTSTTTTTTAPTTTTTAPTTTTTPSAVVQVNNEGVQAGEAWIYFGFDDEAAISAISVLLGAPAVDTGWIEAFSSPYGVCPGPVVRGVEWGSFVALFTQAETDFWTAGVPHFFAYYYTDGSDPAGITTSRGVAIGDTLGDLEAAYPGEITVEEAWFDETIAYWSYRQATWTGMWGYADGFTADSHITSINGGQGCGE